MPLLTNTMHSNSSLLPAESGCTPRRSPWLALVLPITLVAGCASGPNSRDIIDYTVTEAEYYAATTPVQQVAEAIPAPPSQASWQAPSMQAPSMQAPSMPAPTIAAAEVAAMPEIPKPLQQPAVEPPAAAAVAFAEPPAAKPAPLASLPTEEPVLASAIGTTGFGKSIYAVAGLGGARLSPDTTAVEGWTPDDTVSGGGQITVGADLSKRLSLEVHSGDFGSAGLSPLGRVEYYMNGVSALLYAGKNVDRYRRQGLNGYARVGFNQIRNKPIGEVPFIEQTSTTPSVGLGVEYNTRSGIGFRADAVAYNSDVQYGQLGMLYRMGKKPQRAKLATADNNTEVVTLDAEPLLGAATPAMDLPELSLDNTTDMRLEQVVDEQLLYTTDQASESCMQLNGTLHGVNFFRGSASLTKAATNILNNVAETLNSCTNRLVVINAHTDNEGSAFDNNALSKNRARSVVRHLARQGVSLDRMNPVAYGESSPVASNKTLEGRMRNRRVEINVQ